jgi:uncharacterized damage-inducible protein DinB
LNSSKNKWEQIWGSCAFRIAPDGSQENEKFYVRIEESAAMSAENDLRYLIGEYSKPPVINSELRIQFVKEIETAPAALRWAVANLSDLQLDTPYRKGGWTVRRVVHHLPDSHMNAYIRFKLALTEDVPVVKPYDETLWAQIPEAMHAPITCSLDLLDALHRRWVACIRELSDQHFNRKFRHLELGEVSLDEQLAHYAWHGRHHIAQITSLKRRMGWM